MRHHLIYQRALNAPVHRLSCTQCLASLVQNINDPFEKKGGYKVFCIFTDRPTCTGDPSAPKRVISINLNCA
jgi:hypothetical protein